MMTSNQAVGLLSQALSAHDYPTSYLHELTKSLGIKVGDAQDLAILQSEKVQAILTSIVAQVPVEYIVREALFYERRYKVSPDVLIPRFDTEKLVKMSLEVAQLITEPLTIIDIGTGSGAIIVTLAKELESRNDIEFLAMDISPKALAIAKENAEKHSVQQVIAFQQADTFPKDEQSGPFLPKTTRVLLVSNPPYISEKNYAALPNSVKDYEPALALLEQPDFLERLAAYIKFLQNRRKLVHTLLEYCDSKGTVVQISIPSENDFLQTVLQEKKQAVLETLRSVGL